MYDLFGCFFLVGDGVRKAEQAYEIRLVERFKSRSSGVLFGITYLVWMSHCCVKVKNFSTALRVFYYSCVFPAMDQERVYLLLAKYLAGEATAEEREELEWAMLADPTLGQMEEHLSALRQAPPKGISSEEEQAMLQRGLERFSPVRSIPVVRRLSEVVEAGDADVRPVRSFWSRKVVRWVAAASVLVLVSVSGGIFWWRGQRVAGAEKAVPVAVLSAGRGTRKMARLPDGTQLWLNAGSRIVLAQGFSHDRRELTLEGEAFFDVMRDEDHPFIIHTGALEVRVLGTSLNVRAYPGEASVEATLIEGKAEIGLAGNPQSAIALRPNENIVIPTSDMLTRQVVDSRRDVASPLNYVRKPIVPDRTDGTIVETSWTKNKLVFRNETLSDLSTRLERWYAVTIVFDDKRYLQDTISGTFPDMPIDDVMHALRITSGFDYKIKKDTVHIW